MSVHTRDPIVAKTKEGKRIFGYNEKGVPVCSSQLPGKEIGRRCQSTMTMPNGRCKKHGGYAPTGIMHWNAQELRTVGNLPKHLQSDMTRALEDPDHLNLKHEIAMVDTHIATIKEALGTGLDIAAWKRIHTLADKLEHSLENDPESSELIATQLINTIRIGSGERVVWKEYHEAAESRRKLTETASKREIQLKTLLKGDQILALVTGMAAAARDCIGKLISLIENTYILTDRKTGLRVDSLPGNFKSGFLGDMSISLGNLIGKPRPNSDIPSALDGVRPEDKRKQKEAIMNKAMEEEFDNDNGDF